MDCRRLTPRFVRVRFRVRYEYMYMYMYSAPDLICHILIFVLVIVF